MSDASDLTIWVGRSRPASRANGIRSEDQGGSDPGGGRPRRERGATAVEYAIVVALIAGVIAATVALIGPALLPGFQAVVNGL